MNDQPEQGPSDLPPPPTELPSVEDSTKPVDNSLGASSRGVDEEAPMGVVEPQLVLKSESPETSPTKRPPNGFKGPSRLSSTVININQLPQDVADNLRPYDINGDGMISLTELVHGALTQNEQQEKVC